MSKEPEYRKVKIEGSNYTLVHRDHLPLDHKAVEKMYNAKYLGEFTLKAKGGGWANMPVAIYYTEKAHPEGSNYFGLFRDARDGGLRITNGIQAVDHEWSGVLDVETGEVLYSAYRHDYQTYNNLMADGGPDYLRCSVSPIVKFKILKDEIIIVKGVCDERPDEDSSAGVLSRETS